MLRAFLCPLLLAALLATGMHHDWNALAGRGMWAAGVRPLTGIEGRSGPRTFRRRGFVL